MKSIYAIKRNQLHTYDKMGKRLFVTRMSIEELPVIQVKTADKDKYSALQVAIGTKSKLNKPENGHLKSITKVPMYLREIRLDKDSDLKTGDIIAADQVLTEGDYIKVTSISKGKGFAGGMKRHGFRGGPRTHGQSDRERAPGAIGQGTSPGRIWKGKRMAGRMGNETISTMGSQVVKLDTETGELWVTGAVPGGKNALVELTKIKNGKFAGLIENPQKAKLKAEEAVADKNSSQNTGEAETRDMKSEVVEDKTGSDEEVKTDQKETVAEDKKEE